MYKFSADLKDQTINITYCQDGCAHINVIITNRDKTQIMLTFPTKDDVRDFINSMRIAVGDVK